VGKGAKRRAHHGIKYLTDASIYTREDRWRHLLLHGNASRPIEQSPGTARCALPELAPRSPSKIAKREKGIWQRRYWEHTIRNDEDLERHINYIHFNPVKHGLVTQACNWPHSSFHRYVARGELPPDWGGDMRNVTGSFGE